MNHHPNHLMISNCTGGVVLHACQTPQQHLEDDDGKEQQVVLPATDDGKDSNRHSTISGLASKSIIKESKNFTDVVCHKNDTYSSDDNEPTYDDEDMILKILSQDDTDAFAKRKTENNESWSYSDNDDVFILTDVGYDPKHLLSNIDGDNADDARKHTSSETITFGVTTTAPTSHIEPVAVGSKEKKSRYIPINGIMPGAVRVPGIIRRSFPSGRSSQFSVNRSSSYTTQFSTSFQQQQQQSIIYRTEGDLAPIELLERVEAVPWVDSTASTADGKHHDHNHASSGDSATIKRRVFRQRLLLVMLSIVVIAVCVSLGVILSGYKNSNVNQPQGKETGASSTYRSFQTSDELFHVVHQYISDQNVTPSLEEVYGPIEYWDVSKIQNFSYLFDAFWANDLLKSKFNKDLSRWDVSSATNMSHMFYGAREFRSDLSNWNISQVVDMGYFLCSANHFDTNVSKWDTSHVIDASFMFFEAKSFRGIGIENWNVSQVKTMAHMFQYTHVFDANVSQFDLGNVKDTSNMFSWSLQFRGIGIEHWDVRTVEDMNAMFAGTTAFDANLSKWNVSNVIDTSWMFFATSAFQGRGLEHWDTSRIVTMSYMFCNATALSYDSVNLITWNLSNVQRTTFMFAGTSSSSYHGILGIEHWDTSNVQKMYGMFHGAILFNANLSKWNTSNVMDASFLFDSASSFQGVGLEHWDTRNLIKMTGMFRSTSSFDANLSSWDVGRVIDMTDLFWNASSFQGRGIGRWNTSSVRKMVGSFGNTASFDGNLSNWDVSHVFDMTEMFYNATSFHGDGLQDWHVRQLNHTYRMFDSAISFHADLSRWNISNIINSTGMFHNATSFEGVFWWNDTNQTIIDNSS